jgi:hypothetical protein
MKYLVFDEMNKADFDKVSANVQTHFEEREKGNLPPHTVSDHFIHGDLPQFTQSIRAFKIYETNDPQQLANIEMLWTANDVKSWKRWIIPITERTMMASAYERYAKKLKG